MCARPNTTDKTEGKRWIYTYIRGWELVTDSDGHHFIRDTVLRLPQPPAYRHRHPWPIWSNPILLDPIWYPSALSVHPLGVSRSYILYSMPPCLMSFSVFFTSTLHHFSVSSIFTNRHAETYDLVLCLQRWSTSRQTPVIYVARIYCNKTKTFTCDKYISKNILKSNICQWAGQSYVLSHVSARKAVILANWSALWQFVWAFILLESRRALVLSSKSCSSSHFVADEGSFTLLLQNHFCVQTAFFFGKSFIK